SELLLCHGMVCVVGRMRDLILQLSKSSIYSTKPIALHRSVELTRQADGNPKKSIPFTSN
ncbi:MAG: hypothetical protein E6X99_23485, partial [Pantoea sp.]|nr:hypothetical protein [Pantoea sp.]